MYLYTCRGLTSIWIRTGLLITADGRPGPVRGRYPGFAGRDRGVRNHARGTGTGGMVWQEMQAWRVGSAYCWAERSPSAQPKMPCEKIDQRVGTGCW